MNESNSGIPSRSARPEDMKSLKSLVSTYAEVPSDSVIVSQYVERLEQLLGLMRSKSINTDALRSRLVKALQDKEKGGFATLACELGAVAHFLNGYPNGFCYQVTSNAPRTGEGTKKSFDFSFETKGITFNVEVKAFAPKPSNINEKHIVKSFLLPESTKALYEKGVRFSSNCAPAIANHLSDANSQLTRPARGLSVMLLCCNDLDEQADALTCFVGKYGICRQTKTQGIVPAPAELPNIDAVVICHLGLLQSGVIAPQRFTDAHNGTNPQLDDGSYAWDYSRSLPVALLFQVDRVPPDDIQVLFGEVFRSVHAGVHAYMKINGDDAQTALFSVFNEIRHNV